MNKLKVLIADDSAAIRKVLELSLTDEGLDVVTAADGDAAMTAFVEQRPDLVMVDAHMPGSGGLQICEFIKGDDDTRDVPVVLLAGSYEDLSQARIEKAGADHFFTKPFSSIREVVDKVLELLDIHELKEQNRPDISDIEGLYRQSLTEADGDNTEEEKSRSDTPPLTSEKDDSSDTEAAADPVDDESSDAARVPADLAADDELIEVVHHDIPATEPEQPSASGYAFLDPFSAPAAMTEVPPVQPIDAAPADETHDERPRSKKITIDDISPELIDEIVERTLEKINKAR